MRTQILLLAVVVAAALAQADIAARPNVTGRLTHGYQRPLVESRTLETEISHPMLEKGLIHALPTTGFLEGSTLTATKHMLKAAAAHKIAILANFIDKNTIIRFKSNCPSGGVYKGMKGLMEFGYKHKLLGTASNVTFEILFADEDRMFSVVGVEFDFLFNKTGNFVQRVKNLLFIQWKFGKILEMDILERDHARVMEAYRTKAERAAVALESALFACAGVQSGLISKAKVENVTGEDACARLNKLISDNFTSIAPTLYPAELRTFFETTGKEHLKDFLANHLFILNNTFDIEILYSDDSYVVSKIVLAQDPTVLWQKPAAWALSHKRGGNVDCHPMGASDPSYIYQICTFDENGLLTNHVMLPTKPVTPWDMLAIKQMQVNFVPLGGAKNVTQ